MQVTFFLRCQDTPQFSIERVFEDVRRALPEDLTTRVATSRFPSRGVLPRVYNAIEAIFRQGDINHITGDVHYVAVLLRKRKTLLTIHDCTSLERLKGWRRKVVHFFWYWLPIKRSALVSVISESTREQLLRYVRCPLEKIRLVHDPVSNDFQPAHLEFHAKKPVVLQVGTAQNKNLVRVAEALRGIPSHLRIIGELDDAGARALSEFDIEYSSVARISGAEIVEEYRRCDMLVFASTYEGFGLPILEAQATGRPVVASNLLSMPEVAGGAACLVDPFDVSSIREGILKVVGNADYRGELVQRGFENVERFRPEAIAQRYLELYKELSK